MDERALRAWLAKRLNAPDVRDPLWDYLVDGWYVKDALAEGTDEGREKLLDAAKAQLALARALAGRTAPPGRSETDLDTAPMLGAYEIGRADAVWAYVAQQASSEPRLRRFREKVLSGRALAPDEVRHVLTSPATRLLTERHFAAAGIPIVGHRAAVVNREEESTADGFRGVAITLRLEWPGGVHEDTHRRWHRAGHPRPRPTLAVLDDARETHEVRVWPDSVLDELRKLSEQLATWYGLRADQAARFVLTGELVPWMPVQVGVRGGLHPTHETAWVTLRVEPWVPAETVLRVYRDVQRRLLGRDNRPVGDRSLALLRFVTEQGEVWTDLTWPAAMERWNRDHPEWRYETDRRFARDVKRAQQVLLFPKYRFSWEHEEGAES